MSNSTVQFITQMKLRELHRQRAKLREAYQQLSEEVAQGPNAGDRLCKLYSGLRKLKFAGQSLHPELKNLEVLLHAARWEAVSPEVLTLWQGRLEDELAAGRLRAEFVYLFGALLEEWARESARDDRLLEESRQARKRLLDEALAAPGPNRHHEVLDPLFAAFGETLAELGQELREACEQRLREPVHVAELDQVLNDLARNIYQPPRLRREARQFTANDELKKELADALTILVAELHTWDWPAEGLPARALWTRNKWRLYLGEDLPTACLLEVVGER